jgi:molecular chaperone DnaK (HSP70)
MKNKIEQDNFIQNENSIDGMKDKNINIYNTDSKINNLKSVLNTNNKNKYNCNIIQTEIKKQNNNNIIDIPISFTNNNANKINSSLFNKYISPYNMDNILNNNYQNNNNNISNNSDNNKKKNIGKITNKIFYNQNNKIIDKNIDINIIKSVKYEYFKIKDDKNIYIGLDLGNTETKIGIIKNYNSVQLMCFGDNIYSIPTMVSFNNGDIYIGAKTEELMINNPTQTIFNIMKIFGHEYDEIINSNNKNNLLWPFKLYKDNFKKPYVKIKNKGDEKIYYFEDILIIFLKKLFELIFKKISIDNNKKNTQIILNLTLVVSVPNSFSFYQRKLLEKIFYSEILPKNNSIFSGFSINLDKIGIEDRSSIACLCLKTNPKIKNNNILILNLDSCCIDMSIISIFENINKVIAVDSIELLEEDFNDNFINLCLKLLKKNNVNIPKEFLYSECLLSKLRKLTSNIIKNLTINEDAIFVIDNLNNGNGNCVIQVNRIDYDEICFELCKTIIISIKNLLVKARLNENDINDIILLGDTIKINKLNQMIKELFVNNKNIYDKLTMSKTLNKNINININKNEDDNNKNKNYFIVAGAALQAYNISENFSMYVYKNINPVNIGIEAYDGSMDVIAPKNVELPFNVKKNIKIKNDKNNVVINVYEGKEKCAKSNRLISQFVFNKNEFKFTDDENNKEYYEVLIAFEIDYFLNIKFFVNDDKTNEHLFKCEINIEKFNDKDEE